MHRCTTLFHFYTISYLPEWFLNLLSILCPRDTFGDIQVFLGHPMISVLETNLICSWIRTESEGEFKLYVVENFEFQILFLLEFHYILFGWTVAMLVWVFSVYEFFFIYLKERLMKIEQQRTEKEMKQQAIENVRFLLSTISFMLNKCRTPVFLQLFQC